MKFLALKDSSSDTIHYINPTHICSFKDRGFSNRQIVAIRMNGGHVIEAETTLGEIDEQLRRWALSSESKENQ